MLKVLGEMLKSPYCRTKLSEEPLMSDLVCCLDLGSTNIKAALFDEHCRLITIESEATAQVGADSTGTELDAQAQCELTTRLVGRLMTTERVSQEKVIAVCVTNQRATVVPVANDGRAVGPAISWQDTRCENEAEELACLVGRERLSVCTGLPPSFLWTASKLLWLRKNRPGVWQRADRFVLLHDMVLKHLGADELVTDPSNASLTAMFDLTRGDWDPEILAALGLTRSRLPQLRPAGSIAGRLSEEVASVSGLAPGTPLVVGGGDQQCAALGLGVIDPGQVGLCLGTAAVLSCPTDHPVGETNGRFFCTAHVVPDRFVMEGIHNAFGSSLQWAVAMLGLKTGEDLEELAARAPVGAAGVVFLPHLAGIGSPDFDGNARGAFLGLDASHRPSHLARAVLEGLCLEIGRILAPMEPHAPFERMIVAGGGSTLPLLGRVMADLTDKELVVSQLTEATLAGAAVLAWMGAGRFQNFADAVAASEAKGGKEQRPRLEEETRRALRARFARWVSVVGAATRISNTAGEETNE